MLIREFVNKNNYKERNKLVKDRIQRYYSNNMPALTDGICNDLIIIGEQVENSILEPYRMNMDEFKAFAKTNKVLSQGFKTVNRPLKLGLLISYWETKDNTYLDMIGLLDAGSFLSNSFKYGVSSPDKMKYVIEHKTNEKFLIRKHGSVYGAIQEQIRTITTTPKLKKQFERMNDDDVLLIINRISTSVRSMLLGVTKLYYDYLDEEVEEKIILQSENNLEGKMTLTNNSIELDNLKNIVKNYMPTSIDHEVVKVVKIKTPVKKYLIKSLMLDKEKKYFSRLGMFYIDYYAKQYSGDINVMKKDFINKMLTARLNDPDYNKLVEEITEDIRNQGEQYAQSANVDVEKVNTLAGSMLFFQDVRAYVVIKIRKLMNEVR